MAYFLYVKDAGSVKVKGEDLAAYWLTARSTTMSIPGGVFIVGSLKQSSNERSPFSLGEWYPFPEGHLFPDIIEPAMRKFVGAFNQAWRDMQNVRNSYAPLAQLELLDFLDPTVCRVTAIKGTQHIFYFAFTEREAQDLYKEFEVSENA